MPSSVPVFRFAPSPNGRLHLGHALSAILNDRAAKATGGRLLLRIENIDQQRCTPQLEADMIEDLERLGLDFEPDFMRQSDRFPAYREALAQLNELGLTYRAYVTRGEIKRFVAEKDAEAGHWPRDPDGAPLYPGDLAVLGSEELERRRALDAPYAIRLNMEAALSRISEKLEWWEGPSEVPERLALPADWMNGERISANPAAWGDVILARKDSPTSYHLSVVVDDAAQEITDVIRGEDLYQATSVHRLLQCLLGLPEPRYRHHRLILDADGKKLAKSDGSTSLSAIAQRSGWGRVRTLVEHSVK